MNNFIAGSLVAVGFTHDYVHVITAVVYVVSLHERVSVLVCNVVEV